MRSEDERLRLLSIDTCGETSAVALSEGAHMLASQSFGARTASAEIVAALRSVLADAGWRLMDLGGIGVVSGPGSFTGVRTGLAVAKGLCEAAGLKLATVSRLEVLARAAGLEEGLAMLSAGRQDVYVRREQRGEAPSEFAATVDALQMLAAAKSVVVAEESLADLLQALQPTLRPLHIADAIPLLLAKLTSGGEDAASADANYVRQSSGLYAQQGRRSPAAGEA